MCVGGGVGEEAEGRNGDGCVCVISQGSFLLRYNYDKYGTE